MSASTTERQRPAVRPAAGAAVPATHPQAPTSDDAGALATVGAYVALTKPRIVELLLVTTVPPMILAAGGWPGIALVLTTLVGGTLVAGAANALNMVLDRDIDAVMGRTRSRPLPAGRLTPRRATVFALVLAVVGTGVLAATTPLAAWLAVGALVFYVGVYTALLKRRTVQNIVIGGAAGAAPALIGWAAVTGDLSAPAWVLFAVVFLWTPPHFWALAIVCRDDYEDVAVPMLPVVRGPAEAARRSLRYTVTTVVASLALPLVGAPVGWVYLGSAVVLGTWFTARAVALRRDARPRVARRLFTGSIAYLALVFTALAVDQLVPLA